MLVRITIVLVLATVLLILINSGNGRVEHFFQVADGRNVCNGQFYMEIPDFLTHAQCDALRGAAQERGMVESKVGEAKTELDKNIRNSMQVWFRPEDHPVADFIRGKVMHVLKSSELAHCFGKVFVEDIQVVKYNTQGKYDPHFDTTECGADVGVECTATPRIATVLIYLNDDFMGGETRFPNLGFSVKPKKGKAVLFWVVDPSSGFVYKETLHGGDPVSVGEKWIATQWIHRSS